jgi:small-conductance mechanosensitive channel
MIGFAEMVTGLGVYVPTFVLIASLVLAYIVFKVLFSLVKRNLLRFAKTKKQKSNVEIFSAVIKYIFVFFLALYAVFYYSGDWTGLGLGLGLVSAAIGFALQRPIAGIAAWIMIVTRRPFDIGDRIIIGTVKGDVTDISLTHITLKEVGGLIQTEENSGRTILVPNNILFEQNIINYTHQDEYVLTQVEVSVTYESNLEKAEKICFEAAKKTTTEFFESLKKEPYVRLYFQSSGVAISIRFFSPAKRVAEVSSNVTKEIYKGISRAKDIEFAYPHTQVVMDKKVK